MHDATSPGIHQFPFLENTSNCPSILAVWKQNMGDRHTISEFSESVDLEEYKLRCVNNHRRKLSESKSSDDFGLGLGRMRTSGKCTMQLPQVLQVLCEYIHRHYRCEWPLPQVLLSAFSIHNETLNVWTHLIGFFIFLALTIYTATQVPNVVDIQSLQHVLRNADIHKIQAELVSCLPSLPHLSDLQKLKDELKSSWNSMEVLPSLSRWHLLELLSNCLPHRFTHTNETSLSVLQSMKEDIANMIAPQLIRPIARWPFFAFLGGAMFCLLASSTCHLLSCHSRCLAYIMLRLDYAGIAALIATSFYPPVYYSFMCYPFFCNLYLSFITILGVATIAFSLLPVFQNPEFRTIRACLFFGMGASGVIPVLHKLVLFWHQPEALHTTGYEVLMGLFYGLGALVYATRVPERWMPGKFEIAGHSHQLFHVLVVAGAYTHYHAGLVYLKWRDLQGC